VNDVLADNRAEVFDRTFWQALAPEFHIESAEFLRPREARFESATVERGAEGLADEGYAQFCGLDLEMDIAPMAALARRLSADNLHPIFAFVYDEYWRPYFTLDSLYHRLLGDYVFLPNFWAWNVDPRKGESGWGPHRDVGCAALLPDGSPKSLTTWIALSQATPLNGCLHMVPKHADPTYGTPNEGNWHFAESSVRELPAAPGDVLMWNQAVVHWGGASSPAAAQSRVSLSLEVQRSGLPLIEAPAIAPWQNIPFAQRLQLIGKKILHYRHMTKVDPALEELAHRLAE
jgi:hypothetical protein